MNEGAGRFVAFGEIMLRFSPPGRELLLQTPKLDMFVAGAEANVVSGLALLGHETALVSAVPDNAMGDAAIMQLRGLGVDTASIQRRAGRMGLYFVTSGAGVRATEVIYDRGHSSFFEAPASAWDWPTLLQGAGRLHLSGITPALGPEGTRAAIAAADAAEAAGVPISFDGNYRERLWSQWEGRPRETLNHLVSKADIFFGNHRDVTLLLDKAFTSEGETRRREAAEAAFAAFPKLRLMASTARTLEDVERHRLAARIDTPQQGFQTPEVLLTGIVDRIGGGDAFAVGVLHGLAHELPLQTVAATGLAVACLKHSLPGDASLFHQRDIDAFLAGAIDVRR